MPSLQTLEVQQKPLRQASKYCSRLHTCWLHFRIEMVLSVFVFGQGLNIASLHGGLARRVHTRRDRKYHRRVNHPLTPMATKLFVHCESGILPGYMIIIKSKCMVGWEAFLWSWVNPFWCHLACAHSHALCKLVTLRGWTKVWWVCINP